MQKTAILLYACVLASIVVLSNYCVQFRIYDSYLTYGALTYPISFLLLDILSEKYERREVLKVLKYGIILAFIPSFFISAPLIAIASISAFCISQPLDVFLFYACKKYFPRFWWLRNNLSTIIAQFFDTIIFFSIAFWLNFGFQEIIFMALFDFSIKIALSLLDTPFFYIFAIRLRCRFF